MEGPRLQLLRASVAWALTVREHAAQAQLATPLSRLNSPEGRPSATPRGGGLCVLGSQAQTAWVEGRLELLRASVA